MKNNKWFELTVRGSVTEEVLDVDQATYFRALYDTYARPYQRKTNIDLLGQNLGQNPLSSSPEMAESVGNFDDP